MEKRLTSSIWALKLFNKLKKQIVERILESELEQDLGYSKHSIMVPKNWTAKIAK